MWQQLRFERKINGYDVMNERFRCFVYLVCRWRKSEIKPYSFWAHNWQYARVELYTRTIYAFVCVLELDTANGMHYTAKQRSIITIILNLVFLVSNCNNVTWTWTQKCERARCCGFLFSENEKKTNKHEKQFSCCTFDISECDWRVEECGMGRRARNSRFNTFVPHV